MQIFTITTTFILQALLLGKADATTTCVREFASPNADENPSELYSYTVTTTDWGYDDSTSKSGCGGGLLDNLRGQCTGGTDVLDWGCDGQEGAHNMTATFTIKYHSSTSCVRNAIYLASGVTGVSCPDLTVSVSTGY